MISITTLQKFKSSPGTMSNDELEDVRVFLKVFKEYHSHYTKAERLPDWDGVCRNEIQAALEKVCWYITFKGDNE